METCTLPTSLKLPAHINAKEFQKWDLNPVVVLTDFKKSIKKITLDTPPSSDSEEAGRRSAASEDELRGLAFERYLKTKRDVSVPSKSSSKPSSRKRQIGSTKRKRESWDPSVEYEIEKIVGYHRDKRNKMWYLVKWKDWSREYNTFEPIENLTGCHFKLMEYFELSTPTNEDIQRMNSEIVEGLKKREIFKRLTRGGYKAEDLAAFSRDCLDLKAIFELDDLEELKRETKWEYICIVRCLIGMCSHQDPGLVRRAQDYKLFLKLIKLRRRQLEANSAIEKLINAKEKTGLTIENAVDLEVFPELEYIVDLKLGEGIEAPKDPLLGCECLEGCGVRSRCCGKMADSVFAYTDKGRLRHAKRVAIYECNSRCSCPPTCPNRVVQRGRRVRLCIFKTKHCGWGVKALERIPRGAFVCEYLGELIPDSVAVVRDVNYSKERRSGYLFDLDFFMDLNIDMYCIDATKCGNVARFINHSCDPNLVVHSVWIDRLEPNIHRLAFFAKKTIETGEEIHFDYLQRFPDEEGSEARMVPDVKCHCNARNCRGWVFWSS